MERKLKADYVTSFLETKSIKLGMWVDKSKPLFWPRTDANNGSESECDKKFLPQRSGFGRKRSDGPGVSCTEGASVNWRLVVGISPYLSVQMPFPVPCLMSSSLLFIYSPLKIMAQSVKCTSASRTLTFILSKH